MGNRTGRADSRVWLGGALMLLAVCALGGTARGDDDASPRADLELRIYGVGALTQGVPAFLGPVPGGAGQAECMRDETPLFGGESEEPFYPVGQVDELIELIKGGADPAFWESTEGADIASLGEGRLVVRATRGVHAEVAAYLARTERDVLRSVRVEVRAVPADADLPADAEALQAWLSGPEAGPGASYVAFAGQRAGVFAGREVAYVADYNVVVAENSVVSDPVVGVANLGLFVDGRATPVARTGAVDLDLRVSVVDLQELRRVDTGGQRPAEAPRLARTEARGHTAVPGGRWAALGAGSAPRGWRVFARGTVFDPPATAAHPADVALPGVSNVPMELRIFDVTDLGVAHASHTRPFSNLWPSNFTPPEPPELPEPQPAISTENLVELVVHASPPEVWMDPATLEARNGRLIARQEPPVLDAMERLLGQLRRDWTRPLVTEAVLVDMPATLAAQLAPPGASAPVLDAAGSAKLAAALEHGDAQRLDRLELVHQAGARNTVRSGDELSYVQDYEVVIAQGAQGSNPVPLTYFLGRHLDVRGSPTSAGDAALLEVRFQATDGNPTPRVLETPAGPIELPEMQVFNVRSSLVVPLGRTVLYAAEGRGERVRALLLTPRMADGR